MTPHATALARLRPARAAALFAGLFCFAGPALSAVLNVGAGQTYERPSEAARKARDGDLVVIHEGVYEADYAVWSQDDLTIMGRGTVRLVAGPGHIPNGKAIWILRGQRVRIANIGFEKATVRDKNGAGIRLERGSLTVENCRFAVNETGIMTSNHDDVELVIKNSVFDSNTQDYYRTGKLGHNLYVGQIAYFEITDSEVFGARVGHNIKTRAASTRIVGNRVYDNDVNQASYQIDVPNGGEALIEDNVIIQGEGSENRAMVSFAAERSIYPNNALVVRGNVFINERSGGIAIVNHALGATVQIDANAFEGVRLEYLGGLKMRLFKLVDKLPFI